jgi:hypothetical protein
MHAPDIRRQDRKRDPPRIGIPRDHHKSQANSPWVPLLLRSRRRDS